MAKEPTVSSKTPEQIAAMEEEVRTYRAAEFEAAQAAKREAGKPVVDLARSDAFKAMRDGLPAVARLTVEQPELFPSLGIYVNALRNGLDGLETLAAGLAGPEAEPAPAPAA